MVPLWVLCELAKILEGHMQAGNTLVQLSSITVANPVYQARGPVSEQQHEGAVPLPLVIPTGDLHHLPMARYHGLLLSLWLNPL